MSINSQITRQIQVYNQATGSNLRPEQMWGHALNPFEHSLQSYHGGDLPKSK